MTHWSINVPSEWWTDIVFRSSSPIFMFIYSYSLIIILINQVLTIISTQGDFNINPPIYIYSWLVVDLPHWKIWVRQLGCWNSQLNRKSFKIPWFQSPPSGKTLFSSPKKSRWKSHLTPVVRVVAPSSKAKSCRNSTDWASLMAPSKALRWPGENSNGDIHG